MSEPRVGRGGEEDREGVGHGGVDQRTKQKTTDNLVDEVRGNEET